MRHPIFVPIILILATVTTLLSCEDIFEKDISSETVILVGPADSAGSADTLQKFAWEYVSPVATYQLQVVTPSFNNIQTLVADTITPYNLVELKLTRGRQYQWRLRGVNGSSSTVYSYPRTLTIKEKE